MLNRMRKLNASYKGKKCTLQSEPCRLEFSNAGSSGVVIVGGQIGMYAAIRFTPVASTIPAAHGTDDDEGDAGSGYRSLCSLTCAAVSDTWHDEGYLPTLQGLRDHGGGSSTYSVASRVVDSVASRLRTPSLGAKSLNSIDSGMCSDADYHYDTLDEDEDYYCAPALKTMRKSCFMGEDEIVVDCCVSG